MLNSKNVFTVNYNRIAKLTFGLSLLLIFSNCSSNDDVDVDDQERTTIPLFTEADLSVIHGDSEKSWRITKIINIYYDPTYNLEIDLDCVQDDVYTFSAVTEIVAIDLGEDDCFQSNNDGTASNNTDIFEGNLMFRDGYNGKTIILNYTRGYTNEDQTITIMDGTYFALSELTEDKMVFQGESEQFLGEYRQALIFEKI